MQIVPLSRGFMQTAWPIAVFNVMSKPTGPSCNMTCEYCFYRHNAEGGSQKPEATRQESPNINHVTADPCFVASGSPLISEQMLEDFIADYIKAVDNPTVFFIWQGGEPTLAGLEFYRKVLQLQAKHKRKGVAIANSLQTNGERTKGSKEVSSGFQER